MTMLSAAEAETIVRSKLAEAGIAVTAIEVRTFPEETIVITKVPPNSVSAAAEIANLLDKYLATAGFQGFITVRGSDEIPARQRGALKKGVFDPRASDLANLLISRSRTSEVQPSLNYIKDATDTLSAAVARRHHLIFGRRGSGKTTLMVEAKRIVSERGGLTVWLNLQTLRGVRAPQGFLWFVQELLASIQTYYSALGRVPSVSADLVALKQDVQAALAAGEPARNSGLLVPRVQRLIRRVLESEGRALYVFIDELHYLHRDEQPALLDHIHGALRETNAWLKVAGIRHLTRWFSANPPMGLQTGHDADHINLDITLENPASAKVFLESMLRSYAIHVGIQALSGVFSNQALDRLILASGAVPRDYLVLAASGIREAQKRQKAKTVGVQDVNRVAGDAAKVKIAELEDDAAATEGAARRVATALERVREFSIGSRNTTYFRVDLHDKEHHHGEYSLLQDLTDLRLLHLIDSSVSDEREAGRRSEVYVIDLSQYSGQRLKKKLRVLDFEQGRIVLKETGVGAATRTGATPNQRLAILRRGPLLDLALLSNITSLADTEQPVSSVA